jgi:hypothetical protein
VAVQRLVGAVHGVTSVSRALCLRRSDRTSLTVCRALSSDTRSVSSAISCHLQHNLWGDSTS